MTVVYLPRVKPEAKVVCSNGDRKPSIYLHRGDNYTIHLVLISELLILASSVKLRATVAQ